MTSDQPGPGRRPPAEAQQGEQQSDEAIADSQAARLARIHELVRMVPAGQVASYGQIAFLAGLPSARMVGRALSRLPAGSDLPWHRILNSQGRISVRAGASKADAEQARRLRAEGVRLDRKGRVDFSEVAWPGPPWAWLEERGYDVEELTLRSGGLRRTGPWSNWAL